MGFRWRKSFKIFPGFRFNLSHRGVRGQVGASPLSFSFRLFGGSPTKRITASLPGTGLSYAVATAAEAHQENLASTTVHQALLHEALTQAGQMRLPRLTVERILEQPPEVRREVLKAAIPRFNQLMIANGFRPSGPAVGPEAIDQFNDEKIEALLTELLAEAVTCKAVTP